MKLGLDLFNNEQFWDCHEELEDHWLQAGSPLEKHIYWVVIQVATSVFHYRQDNLAGAVGLLNKSRKKIRKILELTEDLNGLDELLDWHELNALLAKIPDEPELQDFSAVSDFKFKKFYEGQ